MSQGETRERALENLREAIELCLDVLAERGELPTLAQFRINLAWSHEDDAFVATVPALPGCAADGPTPAEATRELELALDGHLAARAARDLPRPPGLEQLRSELALGLQQIETCRAEPMTDTLLADIEKRGRSRSHS